MNLKSMAMGLLLGTSLMAVSDQAMAQCMGDVCANEQMINIQRDSALVTVLGFQTNGSLLLRFDTGSLAGQLGSGWSRSDLAKMSGCNGVGCAGEIVLNTARDSVSARIIGLQIDGAVVLEFLEGSLAGQRGANWTSSDLARTQGCLKDLCVGQRAINIARSNAEVTIVGIQQSNQSYVLRFETGSLAGQKGGNWSRDDLVPLGVGPGPGPFPGPMGAVQLSVNNQTFLTAFAGQTVTYKWSSQNLKNIRSYYTADRGDMCPGGITDQDIFQGITKPWVIDQPNVSKTLSAQVQDCQRGVTYTIVVEGVDHSNKIVRSQITVSVL